MYHKIICSLMKVEYGHREIDLGHYYNEQAHNFHTETIKKHIEWAGSIGFFGDLINIGSGGGNLLREILAGSSIKAALCIDISQVALDQGIKLNTDGRISFRNMSVYDINEQLYGKFDFVFMRFALHHFKKALLSLQKSFSVLNDQGKLILLDMFNFEDAGAAGFFNKTNRLRQPTDYKFYSESELRALCAQADFRVVSLKKQPVTLDLARWLNEYENERAVFDMYLKASPHIKRALNFRSWAGRYIIDFTTFMLVAEKIA